MTKNRAGIATFVKYQATFVLSSLSGENLLWTNLLLEIAMFLNKCCIAAVVQVSSFKLPITKLYVYVIYHAVNEEIKVFSCRHFLLDIYSRELIQETVRLFTFY